jgi:WD40 repeat protein
LIIKKNVIKIWNLQSFEKLREIDSSSIKYLEPISDEILISLRSSFSQNEKFKVEFLQIETGQLVKSIRLQYDVCCAKLLTDELIALGLRNGEIKIYNFKKEETIKTISKEKMKRSNDLFLLSNGNLISTSNNQIKYWKLFEENEFDLTNQIK